MQIPLKYFEQYGRVSELKESGILDHLVTLTVNGEKLSYIQVHPTFLYEGSWNLLILLCIFLYRKHKKFDGELLCIYLMGYGAGRFFIEGLRVDQLIIGHTGIAVTQVVCICIFVGGLLGMILGRIRHKKGKLAKVACLCYNSIGFYKKYSNYSECIGNIYVARLQ